MTPICRKCYAILKPVPRSSWLNKDQWDEVKAGDYYNIFCDNPNTPLGCYWLKSEVEFTND